MDNNWIVENLTNAFGVWNSKMTEMWSLLTESPQTFKGGTIWQTIVTINGGMQAIGYGLLVLFFAIGIFRSASGFRDFQRPEHLLRHFIYFVLAKLGITYGNLLEYAVLEEKAAAATAHHNELSAQIKAAEKRMAEIAVLRTHIVNYAKTREVYVAYRKAGYSKKFREEHEEEILLHQAAKNAFDEMGVKKLPKVKELQTEYAKLLEEKKKTYAEYRRSREEMRELLTAKANVDRVLKMEVEQDVEKEKDHGQR